MLPLEERSLKSARNAVLLQAELASDVGQELTLSPPVFETRVEITFDDGGGGGRAGSQTPTQETAATHHVVALTLVLCVAFGVCALCAVVFCAHRWNLERKFEALQHPIGQLQKQLQAETGCSVFEREGFKLEREGWNRSNFFRSSRQRMSNSNSAGEADGPSSPNQPSAT